MDITRITTLCSSIFKFARLADTTKLVSLIEASNRSTSAVIVPSLRSFGLTSSYSTSAGSSSSRQFSSEASDAATRTDGEETIEEIRARIFGTHIGNNERSGRKVLRGKLLGPTFASYYLPDPSAADPMFTNLAAEKAKLKLDRLKRRGKAPPKKGAGKRSKK